MRIRSLPGVFLAALAAGGMSPWAQGATFEWTGNAAPEFFAAAGNWNVFGFDDNGLPDPDDDIVFDQVFSTVPSGIRVFDGTTVASFNVMEASQVNFRPEGLFTVTGALTVGDGLGITSSTNLVILPFVPSTRVVAGSVRVGSDASDAFSAFAGLTVDGAALDTSTLTLGGNEPVRFSVRRGGRATADVVAAMPLQQLLLPFNVEVVVSDPGSSFEIGTLNLGGISPSGFSVINQGSASVLAATTDPGVAITVRDPGSTWTGNRLDLSSQNQLNVSAGGRVQLTGLLETGVSSEAASSVSVSGGARVRAGGMRFTDTNVAVLNFGDLTSDGNIELRGPSTLTVGDNGMVNANTLFEPASGGEATLRVIGTGARLDVDRISLQPPTNPLRDVVQWTAGVINIRSNTNVGFLNLAGDVDPVPVGGGLTVGGQLSVPPVQQLVVDGTVVTNGLLQEGALTINGNANFNGVSVLTAGSSTTVNSQAFFLGDVSGSGGIGGSGFVGFSRYRPGDAGIGGTVGFGGDVGFSTNTLLELELFGATDFDRMVVADQLIHRGRIEVLLRNGFMPQGGEEFDLLDAADLRLADATLVLPELQQGLSWDDSEFVSSGILRVIGTVVPEPGSLLLAAFGVGVACGRRRRVLTAKSGPC